MMIPLNIDFAHIASIKNLQLSNVQNLKIKFTANPMFGGHRFNVDVA